MPAVISMVVSAALYFTNFDKPSDVGYEDQEFKGGMPLHLQIIITLKAIIVESTDTWFQTNNLLFDNDLSAASQICCP